MIMIITSDLCEQKDKFNAHMEKKKEEGVKSVRFM